MPHLEPSQLYLPKQQADAVLAQATPVQNTWYTVLDTTINCRVIIISTRIVTTAETLEIRLTLDGEVYIGSIAATADQPYFPAFYGYSVTGSLLLLTTIDSSIYRSFLCEARSVKVEVRKTTATGTGTLCGKVIYAKY